VLWSIKHLDECITVFDAKLVKPPCISKSAVKSRARKQHGNGLDGGRGGQSSLFSPTQTRKKCKTAPGAPPSLTGYTVRRIVFDFSAGFDKQISVSVGPIERAGTVEEKEPGRKRSPEESTSGRPIRSRHSLALAILAVGLVVVAIILAGTYAYHRLLRTPEEVAMQLAKDVSSRVREIFNMTPRVTVNQVIVIHESYPSFELATVTRETTATYEYRNQWFGSQKTITIKGRFRIKAGFDLSQPAALEVQPKPLKIVAQFPPPKILSVEMLSHEIEKSENGYWNRLNPEDQKAALDELMRTAKVEGGAGIHAEAKKNLEDKLRSLVDQKKAPIQFEYGFTRK